MAPPIAARPRAGARVALLLLVPVPTIGVAVALHAAPGPAGQAVFAAAKLWLLLFPALWYLMAESGRPGWSRPERGGLGAGAALGAVMAVAILAAYWGFLRVHVDPRPLRHAALGMGIGSPAAYLAGAAAWTLANSLVEEYVWRWFVLRQLRALLPAVPAILASAALFTAHHVVAMAAYLETAHVVLGSAAVLAAGAGWSWLYLRYSSIWPGWISHVIADLAVFVIGWHLLFASAHLYG